MAIITAKAQAEQAKQEAITAEEKRSRSNLCFSKSRSCNAGKT